MQVPQGQCGGRLQGRSQGQGKGREGRSRGTVQEHRQGTLRRACRARRCHLRRREGEVRRYVGQPEGRVREGSEGRTHEGEGRREGREGGQRRDAQVEREARRRACRRTRGHARRAIQGRRREVRFDEGLGEGSVRQGRQDALRQDVIASGG